MWMQMVRNPCQPQAHILCKFSHRTRETIRNLGAWKDLRSSCWSRAIFVPPKNAKKLVPPANWIPQSVQTTNFSSHIFAEHVWSTAHSPRPPFLSSSHCRAPCVCPRATPPFPVLQARLEGPCLVVLPSVFGQFYIYTTWSQKNLVTHIINHNSYVILGLFLGLLSYPRNVLCHILPVASGHPRHQVAPTPRIQFTRRNLGKQVKTHVTPPKWHHLPSSNSTLCAKEAIGPWLSLDDFPVKMRTFHIYLDKLY